MMPMNLSNIAVLNIKGAGYWTLKKNIKKHYKAWRFILTYKNG